MGYYIGCDVHKKYSVFVAVDEKGIPQRARGVEHDREGFRSFLTTSLPPGSPIAVETTGNWYWIIDEMERAGHFPTLAHAARQRIHGSGETERTKRSGMPTTRGRKMP